jgi:triacylglycerol lipase
VLVWLHGGGWVWASIDTHDRLVRELAQAGGVATISVDYSLSPEARFPQAVVECTEVIRKIAADAASWGIDPARIAVSGESAGGAMAACLCLMARDRGEYAIAFQHLEMPRLDDRLPDPPNPSTGEFIWRAENSLYCREAYLGENFTSSYGSATRATDLSGLPAAYIMVGALDLFVDECLAYVGRLIRAGVATELKVYPGCFHGFRIAREAAVSQRATKDSLDALRRAFAR